ncbi:MAG: MmgE/PrpD family protein [Chloroflexi bacterium]|nr:MmgE/PrpD family protein [Chloroflexota bacterium]
MKGPRTYSEQLGDFVAGLTHEAIPAEVLQKARLHILDAIGLALAGCGTEWARAAMGVAEALGGPPESRAMGTRLKFPAPNAALVNGVSVHGLDFDDTYIPGQVHVSSFVVPAVLAMAEAKGASGREALAAAVAGYEASCRIARASFDNSTGRNEFLNRGFHTAGILGTLGAAAIAARIMKVDADTTATALGIAVSQSSGILQTQLEGTWTKTLHPGWGAHGGIIACYLAQKGFKAPRQIFEGELGFFRSYLGAGNYDLDALTRALGEKWEMLDISFKLYPAGHGTHFFLESALRLQKEHNLKPDDIAEVRCTVSPFRVHAHFEPRDQKYTPPNGYIARFGLPYLLAVRLLREDVGLDAFTDESIRDPKTLELASKVSYVVDPKADLSENKGHVVIRTKDSRTYENKQTVIPGTPELPATREQIERRFRLNGKDVLPPERLEAIIRGVNELEKLDNVGELVELTAP